MSYQPEHISSFTEFRLGPGTKIGVMPGETVQFELGDEGITRRFNRNSSWLERVD